MESMNLMQKLKNNLSEHSLLQCIKNLKEKEKDNKNTTLFDFLNGLENSSKLKKFKADKDFILNQYSKAVKSFQGDKMVSKLSFGLVKLYNCIFLYMCKDSKENIEYIKNYKNIVPINFNVYMEDLSVKNPSKKSPINSELMANAGMNLNGFSFEFNISYFLKELNQLIELPDLLFDLNNNFYHELDIAFYNEEKVINNQNLSLLRTSCYFCINKNRINNINNKEFEIYGKSLILGEVKTRFPKKLYTRNKKKDNEQDTLEDIIDKLFNKLEYFVKLYNEINLFEVDDIENIQLIFFYDHSEINKIKDDLIVKLINKHSKTYKKFENFFIHFYIVFTVPAITNVSIFELGNEVNVLKEKDKQKEETIIFLKEQDKQKEEKISLLENELSSIRKELEAIKKNKNTEFFEDMEILTTNNNNNNMDSFFYDFTKNKINPDNKQNDNNNDNLFDELVKVFECNNNNNVNKSDELKNYQAHDLLNFEENNIEKNDGNFIKDYGAVKYNNSKRIKGISSTNINP